MTGRRGEEGGVVEGLVGDRGPALRGIETKVQKYHKGSTVLESSSETSLGFFLRSSSIEQTATRDTRTPRKKYSVCFRTRRIESTLTSFFVVDVTINANTAKERMYVDRENV